MKSMSSVEFNDHKSGQNVSYHQNPPSKTKGEKYHNDPYCQISLKI